MGDLYSEIRGFNERAAERAEHEVRLLIDYWYDVEMQAREGLELLVSEMEDRQAAGEEITTSMLNRNERYQSVIDEAMQRQLYYQELAERAINRARTGEAGQGLEDTRKTLREAGVDDQWIAASMDQMSTAAVEQMMALLEDQFPVGQVLGKRFGQYADDARRKLLGGLATGKNPREVARDMARSFDRALSDTATICRTEMIRAYREAQRIAYEDSKQVDYYRRMATHDTRTCIACLVLDGRQYRVNEPLGDHPNGRCTMVPQVRGKPPVVWQSAEEWFSHLPEYDQAQIMGIGRHQAWKDGKFEWGDLAQVVSDPTWGEQVRVVSLSRLLG